MFNILKTLVENIRQMVVQDLKINCWNPWGSVSYPYTAHSLQRPPKERLTWLLCSLNSISQNTYLAKEQYCKSVVVFGAWIYEKRQLAAGPRLNDLLVEPDSGPTNASPGMVKNKIKIHVHPDRPQTRTRARVGSYCARTGPVFVGAFLGVPCLATLVAVCVMFLLSPSAGGLKLRGVAWDGWCQGVRDVLLQNAGSSMQ